MDVSLEEGESNACSIALVWFVLSLSTVSNTKGVRTMAAIAMAISNGTDFLMISHPSGRYSIVEKIEI